MTKPLHTLHLDTTVGICDRCEYVARIYADKITVVSPYVNWHNNSGSLAIDMPCYR